jgi:hypothetical protein
MHLQQRISFIYTIFIKLNMLNDRLLNKIKDLKFNKLL